LYIRIEWFVIIVVWYYDRPSRSPGIFSSGAAAQRARVSKRIPHTPSIIHNTKPLSFDIKPLCFDKFICGLTRKHACFAMFYMVVWQLEWFVGNLENVVWD
jgi:hypothetical protein